MRGIVDQILEERFDTGVPGSWFWTGWSNGSPA
jgi:hypothetical protein